MKTIIGHCDLALGARSDVVERRHMFVYVSIPEAIEIERKRDEKAKYTVEIHFESTPDDERRLAGFCNREAARWEADKASEADGWCRKVGRL